jgi:REP element-mobilizing transposase RayT
MPRLPRPQIPGALYHVFSRGNRRQAIAADPGDFAWFIERLRKEVRERQWLCHQYCVLSNHYHFLIETPLPNLSAGMQRLNGAYAQAFNQRHELDGHVFQGRFRSRLVESDAYFVWLVRYIAMNPVEAGLCSRAEDWPWSSYAATIGNVRKPDFLTTTRVLAQFGRDRESAVTALRRYVRSDAPIPSPRL